MVLGLNRGDVVVLLKISQAPLLPLKSFDFFSELLLDIILFG
jgi:hypothetical protein